MMIPSDSLPMFAVRPLPRGTGLWRQFEPEGIVFTWRQPDRSPLRYLHAVLIGCFVIVFALVSVAACLTLVKDGRFALIFWCVFAWLLVVIHVRLVWIMIQRGKPESIVLEIECVRHDPGTSPIVGIYTHFYNYRVWQHMSQGIAFYRELFSRRVPRTWIRGEAAFALEQVRRQPRLVCRSGNGRVEIGPDLEEADRVWLYDELERWRVGELAGLIHHYCRPANVSPLS